MLRSKQSSKWDSTETITWDPMHGNNFKGYDKLLELTGPVMFPQSRAELVEQVCVIFRNDSGHYTGVDSTNVKVETNTVKMTSNRKVKVWCRKNEAAVVEFGCT